MSGKISNNTSQNLLDIESLTRQAIMAAASLNWKEAAKINQKILKVSKNSPETLNRLAKACNSLGKNQEAQRFYKKALSLDPYNIIAKKNLEKIVKVNGNGDSKAKGGNGHSTKAAVNLSTLFLFEPGKTKVINLLNLAPPQILATISCGDEVLLTPKKHSVAVNGNDGTYLGALPDDLAHKLISYIEGGNKYEAYVKCATTQMLSIFIKEVYKSEKYTNQPSFAQSPGQYPYDS